MKFGFGVPTRGPLANPADIAAIATAGEELGFAIVTVNDHVVVPRDVGSRYPYSQSGDWAGGSTGEAMEHLVLLAWLARVTERMRLLTAVTVVPYRAPVVTAKMLATIDVLSGGRLTLGVGAGWMREEFEALGTPPFEERGRITDEYLRVFKTLWTEEAPSFAGDYAAFDNIDSLPKPEQKPHPPLWIGGESGPAMRRVAALGDGWYPVGSNPNRPLDVPEKYAVAVADLAEKVAAQGRDMADIDLAYSASWYAGDGRAMPSSDGGRRAFTGEDGEVAADIARYAALGVGSMTLSFLAGTVTETCDRMEHFMQDIVPQADIPADG